MSDWGLAGAAGLSGVKTRKKSFLGSGSTVENQDVIQLMFEDSELFRKVSQNTIASILKREICEKQQ